MLKVIFAVFLILHGLVHLLYVGQSAGYFELQPGMVWPAGSWIFSRLLGGGATGVLASVLLVLAALGFVAGGVAIFAGQEWWRPLVVGTAVFSILIFILLWDGGLHHLDDQGAVNLLINLSLLVAVLIFHWPRFEF